MTKLFYLQDARGSGCIGNDLLFWRDGGGYTTDVSKAEVFSEYHAFKQNEFRSSDRPWPKKYIDALTHSVVDIQYTDYEIAIQPLTNLIELEAHRK